MLHYNPQHVSSSTLLIFRRTNHIITACGNVTLCKQPCSMPVDSGLHSAVNRHTVEESKIFALTLGVLFTQCYCTL